MQQAIFQCWSVIVRWMEVYYPSGLKTLRPAAEDKALTKLTSHFPLLPTVLVDSFALPMIVYFSPTIGSYVVGGLA
ncbi:hypothetical protein [Spartinivicinus poritis]|uniref:Uncharacterized protein n=1 Tax=Spartinivicinus poritis TaxID=2994640 RepID=A0ABT5UHS3_9GAMM|nr:hypothetical protein [Spartinivicinus sp. A2-2]MDE1465765.1 hypothetical protein [Spartinivicinus sp. A2-2]